MSQQTTLPDTGYLRVKDVLRYIPVSRSTCWAGVKSGRFPKPVKLGPRTTAWPVESIRLYIKSRKDAFDENSLTKYN